MRKQLIFSLVALVVGISLSGCGQSSDLVYDAAINQELADANVMLAEDSNLPQQATDETTILPQSSIPVAPAVVSVDEGDDGEAPIEDTGNANDVGGEE